MKKPKTYWAGFEDGKPNIWTFRGGLRSLVLFNNRKDAKRLYDDVRKVKIVEVK